MHQQDSEVETLHAPSLYAGHPDDLIDWHYLEQVTGIPVGTWKAKRAAGEGPRSFALTSKHVRYRRADVVAWIDAAYSAGVGEAA